MSNLSSAPARALTTARLAPTPLACSIAAASLSLLGGLTTPVMAADTPTGHHTPSAQQPASETLVVTAVPLSSPVTIHTDPRLPRQPIPASDGADYLKTIPGFATKRAGGTNADPVFRGMFGSRLRVLTNGSEMLGACPNRMDAPTSYITPESYDELTVIKGPQTVRYGPGASAAVINFERGPADLDGRQARLDASVTAGTYGRFDRRIDGVVGNDEGYLRIIANESEANDYQDGDGKRIHSHWNDRWNTDIALGWTPDEDSWWELAVGRGDGEAAYAGRMMDGSRFLRESATLRFRQRNLGEHWTALEGQLGYAYADHVMDNFRLRTPRPMNMGGHGGHGGHGNMSGHESAGGHHGMMSPDRHKMASELDRRTRTARLESIWEWDSLTWQLGIDGQTEEHRRRRAGRDAEGNFLGAARFDWQEDYTRDQIGLFSEATLYMGDSQRLIGGVRYDYYRVEDRNMPMASASAGEARHTALPGGFVRYEKDLSGIPATVYAGLGHVQRFPDYWELKPQNRGPDGENAFEGVQPENTTQLDLGAQYRKDKLSAWVNAYGGYIDDFILFDYTGHHGTRVDNVSALIAGGEIGAGYQLAPQWRSETTLAYAWGQNRTADAPLPQIPPLEARLSLHYEGERYSAGALWRVVDGQSRVARGQGNVTGKDFDESAGFGTLSLNAAYSPSERFTLSAGVDNVFDKTYAEHLNMAGDAGFGFDADTRINEPGRMFWTRLDLRF